MKPTCIKYTNTYVYNFQTYGFPRLSGAGYQTISIMRFQDFATGNAVNIDLFSMRWSFLWPKDQVVLAFFQAGKRSRHYRSFYISWYGKVVVINDNRTAIVMFNTLTC